MVRLRFSVFALFLLLKDFCLLLKVLSGHRGFSASRKSPTHGTQQLLAWEESWSRNLWICKERKGSWMGAKNFLFFSSCVTKKFLRSNENFIYIFSDFSFFLVFFFLRIFLTAPLCRTSARSCPAHNFLISKGAPGQCANQINEITLFKLRTMKSQWLDKKRKLVVDFFFSPKV